MSVKAKNPENHRIFEVLIPFRIFFSGERGICLVQKSLVKSIPRKVCYLSDSSTDSLCNEMSSCAKFNVLKDSKLQGNKKANLIKIWTGFGSVRVVRKGKIFPIM